MSLYYNKIKTLNRQAYGYRDEEFFILKLLGLHESRYTLTGGAKFCWSRSTRRFTRSPGTSRKRPSVRPANSRMR